MKVQKKKKFVKVGWLLFYLYIILLSYFLFFSEHYGRENIADSYRYNLVFFKEIKRFIMYREQLGLESVVVNIAGNILAFAPFGFMLPVLNQKYRSFFYVAFMSLFFSISVELVQLFLKVGIFDVDDIMMNTSGGILGFFAYLVCSIFIKSLRPSKKSVKKKPSHLRRSS